MNEKELQAIEEREAKASAGPWATQQGEPYVLHIDVDARLSGASLRIVDPRNLSRFGIVPHGILFRDDAVFVAHARTDVPKLVAAYREAREMARDAHTDLDLTLKQFSGLGPDLFAALRNAERKVLAIYDDREREQSLRPKGPDASEQKG